MTTSTRGRDDLDQAIRGIARRMREEDPSVSLHQIAAVARILLSPRPEWNPPGRSPAPAAPDPTRLYAAEAPAPLRSRVAIIAQARADALADLGVTGVEAAHAWILDVGVVEYLRARRAGVEHHQIIRQTRRNNNKENLR